MSLFPHYTYAVFVNDFCLEAKHRHVLWFERQWNLQDIVVQGTAFGQNSVTLSKDSILNVCLKLEEHSCQVFRGKNYTVFPRIGREGIEPLVGPPQSFTTTGLQPA